MSMAMGKALVLLIVLAGVAHADQVHLPVSGFDLLLEEAERYQAFEASGADILIYQVEAERSYSDFEIHFQAFSGDCVELIEHAAYEGGHAPYDWYSLGFLPDAFYRYGWESDEDGGDRRMHICVKGYAVSIISYYDHLHNASAMIAQVRDILEKFAAAAGVPDDTTYGPQPVVETVVYDSTPDLSGRSWEPPDLSLEPVYQQPREAPPEPPFAWKRVLPQRYAIGYQTIRAEQDDEPTAGIAVLVDRRPGRATTGATWGYGVQAGYGGSRISGDARVIVGYDKRFDGAHVEPLLVGGVDAISDGVLGVTPYGGGGLALRGPVGPVDVDLEVTYRFPHGPRLAASLTWKRAVAGVNLSTAEEVHANTTTAFVGLAF